MNKNIRLKCSQSTVRLQFVESNQSRFQDILFPARFSFSFSLSQTHTREGPKSFVARGKIGRMGEWEERAAVWTRGGGKTKELGLRKRWRGARQG